MSNKFGLAVVALVVGVAVAPAEAQVLGTFRWQMQPYCNAVVLTITQQGATFTADGTDNQCGGAQQASARGMAYFNPNGTVGFGITIVPANSQPVEVSASISPGTLSGTWRDDAGNSGNFVFNGAAPGSARPLGQTRIALSPGDWRPFVSTDNLTFNFFSGSTRVAKGTTGSNFLSIHPAVPAQVRGLRQQLLGVEFCYEASASAQLTYIEINTLTHNLPATLGTRDLRFSDSTVRTDEACRFYILPTPYTMSQDDAMNVFIGVNWTVASAPFGISRTTLVFAPTIATGVAPADELPAAMMPEAGGGTNRPSGQ